MGKRGEREERKDALPGVDEAALTVVGWGERGEAGFCSADAGCFETAGALEVRNGRVCFEADSARLVQQEASGDNTLETSGDEDSIVTLVGDIDRGVSEGEELE